MDLFLLLVTDLNYIVDVNRSPSFDVAYKYTLVAK